MKEVIDYKKYRKISIIMMLIFIMLIMLTKILVQWVKPDLINYRVMPAIWSCFLFIYIRFIPRVHPIGKISKRENIYLESIVCAAVLTGIQFVAGSMIGQMGESPYILTPAGVLSNFLFILPPIIVREIVRSYVLGAFCNKTNIKVFILVTAILTIMDVNYHSLLLTKNLKDITIYLAQEFGPLIMSKHSSFLSCVIRGRHCSNILYWSNYYISLDIPDPACIKLAGRRCYWNPCAHFCLTVYY